MQDMINKIKQNNALRTSRKKNRSQYNTSRNFNETSKLKFKKVSKEELARINKKNRKAAKKERVRVNLIAMVIFV